MSLQHGFIKKAVKDAIKKHGASVQPEELEKILTAAIYDIFNSRDFEQLIKEIVK